MNYLEIIKKAFIKAERNKFSIFHSFNYERDNFFEHILPNKIDDDLYGFIFSHDFAKAFWKLQDLEDCYACKRKVVSKGYATACCGWVHENEIDGEVWQYHLQRMVLEKDPIRYLEKYL